MTDPSLAQSLVVRYGATQTRSGRWCLKLRHRAKRLLWRGLIATPAWLKRGFDVVATTLILLCLSPLLLLIALLIELQDRGPVLFTQTRVGQWGREFKFYKFRSMRVNAEQQLGALLNRNQHTQGVTFKIKDDPRITRLGKILRKYSLDELPQLYNVLIGDMSLVGPRPPVPREVALYSLEDRRRLAITPGITCLWQVQGRCEIDFSGQVRLDVEYIEHQSFWLDCKILLQTVPAVVSARGAC